ncbi:MAG TPA: hypothetical protein VN872_00390, partial [Candidatus Acidoferrum sp.]|nr:hypothetical protein [Candidatus Acidoferrum sp.]
AATTAAPASVRAGDKWVQTVNGGQEAAGADQAHLDQITPCNLSLGMGLYDLGSVFPGIFSFSLSCF